MEAVTRTRAMWLLAVVLISYVVCLALMGVAFGFGHGAMRWLTAAALTALGVGMAASVMLRLLVLLVDPVGRAIW